MRLDFEGHIIISDKNTIYLTNIQASILEILYKNRGKVIKYEEIVRQIYGIDIDEELKRLIQKHISLMKKKIEPYVKIKIIRDIGYVIEEGV